MLNNLLRKIFRNFEGSRTLRCSTFSRRKENICCTASQKRCKHGFTRGAEEGSLHQGLFSGIRVVDMSSGLAGPYCTQVLGDMGAEVIKIENPALGDESRQWGPPFVGGESCFFISTNRNKKSMAVDINTKQGRTIVHDLVHKSDVFLENFTPSSATRAMGYGYEELTAVNTRLIYASITGFGTDSKKPGYDLVASAVGGLMSITGPEDGGPCIGGTSVTDLITGMYVNGAICSALYERESTNRGKHIHCSLLASQIAYLSHIATNYLNTGLVGERHGCAHGTIVPYQSFETGDDHEIVIGVTNDKFFKAACKALDLSDLLEDPRFESNAKRVTNRKELIPILQERFYMKPSIHWIEKLDELGVPCGRVNNMEDVFDLPQVHALGLVQSIPHPTAGVVKVPGPAIEFEDQTTPPSVLHPPLLGEHTVDILKNLLLYNNEHINKLLENEIVATTTTWQPKNLRNSIEVEDTIRRL